MKRVLAIAVAAAALTAAPAQAIEVKRQVAGQAVTVSVQHCEYGESGDGQCREGVSTPVASSTSTCDYGNYYEYPQTAECRDETSVLGHTVTSEDCTERVYADVMTQSYDCTSSTEAGVGSVRVACEGERHEVNSLDQPSYEKTDTCTAQAGQAEAALVTCATPRDNQIEPALPPVPECEPAP